MSVPITLGEEYGIVYRGGVKSYEPEFWEIMKESFAEVFGEMEE